MVRDKVIEIIRDCFPVIADRVSVSALLIEDLNIDSLDRVVIVFAFEAEFDIEIIDEDFEKWITIQDIIDYIESSLKNDK